MVGVMGLTLHGWNDGIDVVWLVLRDLCCA